MIGVVAEIVIVVVVSVELAIDVLLLLIRLEPSVTPSTSCVRLVREVVRRRLRSAIFVSKRTREISQTKNVSNKITNSFILFIFFNVFFFFSRKLLHSFYFRLNFHIRNEHDNFKDSL